MMWKVGCCYIMLVDGLTRKTAGTTGKHIFVPNDFDGCENVFPIDWWQPTVRRYFSLCYYSINLYITVGLHNNIWHGKVTLWQVATDRLGWYRTTVVKTKKNRWQNVLLFLILLFLIIVIIMAVVSNRKATEPYSVVSDRRLKNGNIYVLSASHPSFM